MIRAAQNTRAVLTVEEHAPSGGLGAAVAQVVGVNSPRPIRNPTLPDAPVITGTSKEVFDYYGMNAAARCAGGEMLRRAGENI